MEARKRARLSESEKKRRKLEHTRKTSRAKVFIGSAIDRWNEVKALTGFEGNTEVAHYLLDLAEREIKSEYGKRTDVPSTSAPSTSTPYRRMTMFTTTLSGISEGETTSTATEQEIDVTGVSGVDVIVSSSPEEMEIQEEKGKTATSEDIQKRAHVEKKLSSSFLDPFDISIDVTHEEEETDIDDQEDPYYEPSMMFEAVLPEEIDNGSEDVAYEEMEFGLEDGQGGDDEASDDETAAEGVIVVKESPGCEWLVDETKVLVFVKQLKTLASMSHSSCKTCGMKELTLEESYFGSAIHFKWICKAGHIAGRWCSQPVLNRRLNSGDFLINGSILYSGNNYGKMALWAKMLKLKFPSAAQYSRVQGNYLVTAVDRFWNEHQSNITSSLQGQEIVVLGDGRNDSPGHCAQYCSYTLMHNDTKQILTLRTVDKRTTQRNSAAMEKAGFKAGIDELKEKGLNIVEVVTDAHMGIGALMKTPAYQDIKHSHDIWHVAKNLGKKITKVAMKKGNGILMPWTKDIVNHFWFVCKMAETEKQFVAIWTGIMHHIVNEHEWVLGHGDYTKNHCLHGPLQDQERNKQWLHPVKNASTLKDLAKIVFDKRLFNQIHKYLHFRSTAELEGFHQHILMYCAKRFAYTPPVYRVRNLLAAIDHNMHINRQNILNRDGSLRLHRTWNKKSGRWTVHPKKEEKQFEYIPELLTLALRLRLEDKVGMRKTKQLEEGDPRRISTHLAPVSPPSTKEIYTEQKSRFK